MNKICCLVLALFFSNSTALAADGSSINGDSSSSSYNEKQQRYQIIMTQVEEKKGELSQLPVLLDTVTGKTWYLSGSLIWFPMQVVSQKPKAYEIEGATYEPPK